MADQEPVKLLILDTSQNRAEELIVLLRKAGRATRAHQIESEEEMAAALKEQAWDLCLARPQVNDLSSETAIGLIRKMEKDIPFILLSDNNDVQSITEGLTMGAEDVALEDDDERLSLIIQRELRNLENRRIRRRTEVELRETERRCELLLDSSQAAIAYVHEGMHIYANQSYLDLFGYEDVDDLLGIPVIDLIADDDQDKFKKMLKSYEEQQYESVEMACVASDGSTIMSELSLTNANYDGEPCTQLIFKQMADDTEWADRLKEISSQDLLTGLYNRHYFVEQLDHAIDAAKSGEDAYVLFYIAIDDFATVRSEGGIANADLVLGDLGSLIRHDVDEKHLLARFGDDVFTMLYHGADTADAEKLADTVRKNVEEHLSEVSGRTFQLTVSIGLALITENAPSSEEIISRAHTAAEQKEGGNFVAFYKQVAEGKTAESGGLDIKEMMENAINNNLLKLLFQPIISLHGDDDEQFEVLLRLVGEDGNDISPGEFLDKTSQAGLGGKMDRWVILQSIKVLAEHRASGAKTRLFVNVTHDTVRDDTFLPWASVALKAARLPSDVIIFQIHESDATAYLKQAKAFSKGLAELHCKVSINHFGCALNPFNTLKHVAVDYVKLDGSFAQGIDTSAEKKEELIDTIKSLQSRGVLTAISGVESPAVLSSLWEAGLNFVQGYYLSPPLETMDYDFASEDM